MYQGSIAILYDCQLLTAPHCTTTQCGTPITFNMIGGNDAGTMDWNGTGIYGKDGKVQIRNACALSDNINLNP